MHIQSAVHTESSLGPWHMVFSLGVSHAAGSIQIASLSYSCLQFLQRSNANSLVQGPSHKSHCWHKLSGVTVRGSRCAKTISCYHAGYTKSLEIIFQTLAHGRFLHKVQSWDILMLWSKPSLHNFYSKFARSFHHEGFMITWGCTLEKEVTFCQGRKGMVGPGKLGVGPLSHRMVSALWRSIGYFNK